MLELYTWTTPNGRKPLVMLEELGVPYEIRPVDLGAGKQHDPAYLQINPNGKIPALVDRDAVITVFESGAILQYLAEKHGRLLAPSGQERASALEWLMFQMSAVGPFMGQLGHFRRDKEPNAGAIQRFDAEVRRILHVLDGRLASVEYLAGQYGIADIATYPWVSTMEALGIPRADFPHLSGWLGRVGARPAVKKAMELAIPRK